MCKGTILAIDDTLGKRIRVRKAAESAGYAVIETSVLEVAVELLKDEEIEAVVLDSQFFLKKEDEKVVHGAGNKLLLWLEEEKKKIPVLGFSYISFQTSYPHFWGQMRMIFDRCIFEKFLFSLPNKEDQSK